MADKSREGLALVLIVGVVAVVSMVMMANTGSGATGYVVKQESDYGYLQGLHDEKANPHTVLSEEEIQENYATCLDHYKVFTSRYTVEEFCECQAMEGRDCEEHMDEKTSFAERTSLK